MNAEKEILQEAVNNIDKLERQLSFKLNKTITMKSEIHFKIRRYINGVSVKSKNRRITIGKPKGVDEFNVLEFKRLLTKEERVENRKYFVSKREGPILLTVLAMDDTGIVTLYEALSEYMAHKRHEELQKELKSAAEEVESLREAIAKAKRKPSKPKKK